MTLRVPGWDLQLVRKQLAFSDIVERQIHELNFMVQLRRSGKFSAEGAASSRYIAATARGCGGGGSSAEDPFARLSRLLKCLKGLMQRELDRFDDNKDLPEENPLPPNQTRAMVETLDSEFWHELFAEPAWTTFTGPDSADWMSSFSSPRGV
jgi:hypothetical protein